MALSPRDVVPQLAQVPDYLEELKPITAKIVGRISAPNGTTISRRTFVRTPDRVCVNYENQGQE